MDDKTIMENLLQTSKGICDLYLHGTIESGTAGVTQTFNKNLNDSLTMQGEIYKKMSSKGWYPTQEAPAQQIQQTKSKFAAQAQQSEQGS